MNAARKHLFREIPVAMAAFGIALGMALAPMAMAQEGAAVAAQGAAVTAKAQLGFRIVIHDVVRVEDGRWDRADEGRSAHLPRFQVREDAVDGRPVLTITQP
ncbi:hypothetical protein [Arenimonas fontis]|uniref:Uncharacterized protein n=1 Tax=Arenimonas fontis TaxID=2608255 RepID=A0A5B2ZDC6_9GAMM|nr:hypothetical protein [Arenimonas fontis]KAA2285062.1 hypothetical protein F0415_07410 [Arenimonas fontis]